MADYEAQRLARIAENRRRMAELGIGEAADSLAALRSAAPSRPAPPRPQLSAEALAARRAARMLRKRAQLESVRRSKRQRRKAARARGEEDKSSGDSGDEDKSDDGAAGGGPDGDQGCDPHEGLLDVLGGGSGGAGGDGAGGAGFGSVDASPGSAAAAREHEMAAFNAARCSLANRGSIYHPAGISCHFCRQKKLCGEAGCPRCSRRSLTEPNCLGKSECGRCGAARGRFCRGCLWARYGEDLDDVRRRAARGEWVCYHCQEEEDPHCGIVCNSSICMTRRGMKPTGAAADEARARGYRSVCHWIRAQLLARAASASARAAAADGRGASAGGGAAAEGETRGQEREGAEAGGGAAAAAAAEAPAAPVADAVAAEPIRRRSARRQQ